MPRKPKPPTASEMGKRSMEKQRKRLGEKAFIKEQSRRGRLGGRPKKRAAAERKEQ